MNEISQTRIDKPDSEGAEMPYREVPDHAPYLLRNLRAMVEAKRAEEGE